MAGSLVLFLALLTITEWSHGTPVSRIASIPIEDVTFQLYTRQSPLKGSRIIIGDSSTLTEFNPKHPTKVIVHGWLEDLDTDTIQLNKNAFLTLEPTNVIGVGWPECSHVILYEKAVECSKQVGLYIGQLVKWLADTTDISPADVHGIGHSLGAQAMSFTSRAVRLGRITALDAAAPLFQHTNIFSQLDKGDADFVEAFHTGVKLTGIKYRVGHLDFYPNGGSSQPGCQDLGGCDHSSSIHFYVHTIPRLNRNAYVAYKCDSVEDANNQTCTGEPRAIMGYGASPTTSGIYYLNITSVPN